MVLLSKEETKDLEEKLKLQQQESARRENVLVMRLTAKEQEMQDLLVCIKFTFVYLLLTIAGNMLKMKPCKD